MRPVTYLRTLFQSLSTPKYYIQVLNVKFSFTARFVVMSYLLISLISGAYFALIEVPEYAQILHTYVDQHAPQFPKDQTLVWNGLKLSSTSNQTYGLPFPEIMHRDQFPPLLLQVNPLVKKVEDIQHHSDKASLIYVGETDIFVKQVDGSWSDARLMDLLPQESFSISAESIQQQLPQVHQFIQTLLRVISIAFPSFFFFITLLFRVLNTVLDTILIYIVVRLFQLPIGFKKTLQISLHVMVIAEIIALLTLIFDTELQMYTITFWTYTALIYWQLRNVQILSSVLVDRDKDQS